MINNTHMAQYIPPTDFHCVTGTWTSTAGNVAGTISKHKSANAETATVSIPIQIPSNSVALQGAKLVSIEVDYELTGDTATSVTATLQKVTRGADTAVAVVTQPAITQDLVAAVGAATLDQHKLTVTLTTPAWIDNDEYYILQLAFVAKAATVIDLLAAVANYVFRS